MSYCHGTEKSWRLPLPGTWTLLPASFNVSGFFEDPPKMVDPQTCPECGFIFQGVLWR